MKNLQTVYEDSQTAFADFAGLEMKEAFHRIRFSDGFVKPLIEAGFFGIDDSRFYFMREKGVE